MLVYTLPIRLWPQAIGLAIHHMQALARRHSASYLSIPFSSSKIINRDDMNSMLYMNICQFKQINFTGVYCVAKSTMEGTLSRSREVTWM